MKYLMSCIDKHESTIDTSETRCLLHCHGCKKWIWVWEEPDNLSDHMMGASCVLLFPLIYERGKKFNTPL